ncbi:putative dimethylaniline monooxygenase [Fonsecaea pedrosoi]|nr:putative dimethylaniline monooxygenase [Fonsecaea pedrosoi]
MAPSALAETPTLNGTDHGEEYHILEQPLGTTRRLRIITIGAGISGINMIRTLRKTMTDYEHVVYEKNPEVGGTWYENRYPGCQCDHPSHNYQFTWKPNPRWTQFSANAEEIKDYAIRCCDDEDMRPEIKLSHKIINAKWCEDLGEWELKIENLVSREIVDDRCHFLLNATGILKLEPPPPFPLPRRALATDRRAATGNGPIFPAYLTSKATWFTAQRGPNLSTIATKRLPSLEMALRECKLFRRFNRVSVSKSHLARLLASQLTPSPNADVKELVHLIRSPTWIAPPQTERMLKGASAEILQSALMDGDKFRPEQIARFENDAEYYRAFIKATEEQVNARFATMVNNDGLADVLQKNLIAHMTKTLKNDPELIKAIIPTTFPAGCRRLTPGPGYLEALTEDNVRVVTQQIARVLPNGIELQSGEVIELDAIVCATGFDVSFCPRFPIIGRNGLNLQDMWTQSLPGAYMSCAVAEMPNYFVFMGPNAPIGHGSVLTIAEQVSRYVVRMMKKVQIEGIKSVCVRTDAVRDFTQHCRVFLPRTVWAGPCRSWYKNGTAEGPITALHPGSRIHWFHMMEIFRPEDYEYVYFSSNRFAFLGNGFSVREKCSNPTWYLDRPNDFSDVFFSP